MQKAVSTLIVALLVLSLSSVMTFAQSAADEEELIKSVFQTGKKAIIIDNMGFTEGESKAFWPVYAEFQQAKDKLNDRMIKLLTDYVASYDAMSDEKAGALMKEYVAIEKERADLKAAFLPKFTKVLPAKKVVRYYQIENKLEAIIKYELAKDIPLVK